MGWECHEPTNLALASFLSIYAVHHPELRRLRTNPVLIERMINQDPVFRKHALHIYIRFCEEMGEEIEKMKKGELQCSYIRSNGIRCTNANEPGSYRCSFHRDKGE